MPKRVVVSIVSGVLLWSVNAAAQLEQSQQELPPPDANVSQTTPSSDASSPDPIPEAPAPEPQGNGAPAPAASSIPPASQALDSERPAEAPSRRRGRRGKALRIVGGAMLAAGYVGSALSYAINSDALDATLLIPVAGPWVALASTDWEAQLNGRFNQSIVVLQGLLQGTGLLLLVVGLVQGSSRNTARASRARRLAVMPTLHGAGAGLAGAF